MLWVFAAIACAAVGGIVSITDSHLLTKGKLPLPSYFVIIGVSVFVIGLAFLLIFPLPAQIDGKRMAAALAAALLGASAAILLLRTIRKEEVSRIIPVVSTSPIFVALLGLIFLGEKLHLRDWAGILITVSGAFLISIQPQAGEQKLRLQKSFFVLLLVALLFAISNISSKYALGQLSFWNMFSINSMIFGVILLSIAGRPATIREIPRLKLSKRTWVLAICNQFIATAAVILSFVAIQGGLVAVAVTITSIRPAFVFVYAALLSRFAPGIIKEQLTSKTIRIRLIAIALTITGIALLML